MTYNFESGSEGLAGQAGAHMKMKMLAPYFLLLVFSGHLLAVETMSAVAISNLLTNNTINCKNLQKNHESTVYFSGDGTATKLNHEGESVQGRWHVTDKGQHCLDWGEEQRCNAIVDMGDGTYQKIEAGKPRAVFTLVEGNPLGL